MLDGTGLAQRFEQVSKHILHYMPLKVMLSLPVVFLENSLEVLCSQNGVMPLILQACSTALACPYAHLQFNSRKSGILRLAVTEQSGHLNTDL